MPGGWVPELRLHETSAGTCRLTLVGVTYGTGPTLQDAADDLVARVLTIVLTLRTRSSTPRPGVGAPTVQVLRFLAEVADRATRGHDVRAFILGAAEEPDPTP